MTMQTRLFVGNLPNQTNEEDLRAAFSEYGEIINLDLKSKTTEDNKQSFAFITLSTANNNVESCLNHYSKYDFKGHKLYVTRARESFLERLQRERQQQQEQTNDNSDMAKNINKPVINLSETLNPCKRKVDLKMKEDTPKKRPGKPKGNKKVENIKPKPVVPPDEGLEKSRFDTTASAKYAADKKRIESMKKKRQEFKMKQSIIKTGLHGVDKAHNKKIVFTDDESSPKNTPDKDIIKIIKNNEYNKELLFDDSGDEISFDIKKQFEGKNGQKVLDLQSRYISDKRFVLDERFIDDEQKEDKEEQSVEENELSPEDEKSKQLDILQDVLGVALKRPTQDLECNKKMKSKFGMLRYDPTHPEHAKFLAPVEEKEERTKKTKKNKQVVTAPEPQLDLPKPEVSKEQFYTVSETLRETIAQPNTFSLRSLFGNNENESRKDDMVQQDTGFIPIDPKDLKKKVKHPLEPMEKNPFVYDSSDSEDENKEETLQVIYPDTTVDVKAVWKENLFFSISDHRLKEGTAFFNKPSNSETHKERRELKSLMKKRIYNNERKNQMFQKKIGGRKKIMKKNRKKT